MATAYGTAILIYGSLSTTAENYAKLLTQKKMFSLEGDGTKLDGEVRKLVELIDKKVFH